MPILLNIVSKFDPKGISNAETGFDKLKAGVNGFAKVSALAFAAAAAGAVAFGVESLKAAANSEAVARSLEVMAKNSKAFSSVTPDIAKGVREIMDYTKNLSNLTGVDDEILNSIVRGWMAVPDLAGKGVKGIENMVKVVADVAAGTGKDIQAVGMAFVKIAGDEETALSKLMRQGIVFTDAQKEMYQSILDTSGEIEAQDYLIGELGTTYAGAAEAAANPFLVLQQNVQNLQEELGMYLLPHMQTFIDKVREFIDTHGPQIEEAFANVADFLGGVVDGFINFSNWADENPDLFNWLIAGLAGATTAMWLLNIAMDANPIGLVILGITALVAAIAFVATNLDRFAKYFSGVWDMIAGGITGAFQNSVNSIIDYVNRIIEALNYAIDFANTFGANLSRVDALARIDTTGYQQALRGAQDVASTSFFGSPANVSAGMIGGVGGSSGMRMMADGGIVMGPTAAIIGEAGPEAVIPLDRMGSMGGGTVYNVTVNGGLATSAEIGQMVVSAIKRYERSNGAVFQAV